MEEKRVRKKFNLVDLVVLVLIVAVLAFAGYKMISRTTSDPVPMTKVTYTVRCEGVPAELYETSKAHLPSPLMASGALVGGQIETVEQKPYLVLDAQGNWVEDPEHVTLEFTVVTSTPKADVMTTKVGEQEVRIGKSTYILKSEYLEFSDCTIVDVEWEK